MSNFICNPEHFNSVEKALHDLVKNDEFYLSPQTRRLAHKWYNIDAYPASEVQREISERLNTIKQLNVLSVIFRDKHQYKGTLEEKIKRELKTVTKKTKVKQLSLTGLYKALSCIDCQIEKEHFKEMKRLTKEEKRALKWLQLIQFSLADHLILESSEYTSEAWEIKS